MNRSNSFYRTGGILIILYLPNELKLYNYLFLLIIYGKGGGGRTRRPY